MQIELHRRDPPSVLGTLGTAVFSGRYEDDVRVHARLTVPAYCYLIALNPDGTEQLCVPERSGPAAAARPRWTSPDPADGIRPDRQRRPAAFVLVAARRCPPIVSGVPAWAASPGA